MHPLQWTGLLAHSKYLNNKISFLNSFPSQTRVSQGEPIQIPCISKLHQDIIVL